MKCMDKVFYQALGLEIRKARQEKNITLYKIARLTGISKSTVDRWELGESRISVSNYKKLCKILNIDSKIQLNITVDLPK